MPKKHDVHQDEVGLPVAREHQALRAIASDGDGVALVFEDDVDELALLRRTLPQLQRLPDVAPAAGIKRPGGREVGLSQSGFFSRSGNDAGQ